MISLAVKYRPTTFNDVVAQENIKAILEAAGASLQDVVKCTVHLSDIREFDRYNKIYATYFPREIRSVQELIRSVKRCETLPVYYKEGGYYLWDMKNPIDAPFHIYEQEQMVCAG